MEHKLEEPEVRPVESFDLQRYLGVWFEVGRLPMRHEDRDSSDVTAEYTLNDDGTVRVDNRCRDKEQEPVQALGQAELDEEHPGRLRVTFLPELLRWIPFTHADYWVLKIADDYGHALVGTPDHKYLWLLSREPRISARTELEFLAEARNQGFNLVHWIRTPQTGYRVTDEQLAATSG